MQSRAAASQAARAIRTVGYRRAMKRCVVVGVTGLALLALPAVAGAALLGTQPPAGGEKAALTSAFWRAHPGQKAKLKLLGLRIWQNHPVAAAYFLARAKGGYSAGGEEYYKRSGSGWRRVSRVPVMDADNLSAAYLFAITSAGTGVETDAYAINHPDAEAPGGADIDVATTTQRFTWNLKFGPRGRPLELGDPGGAVAPNALTGTIGFTSTSTDDPTLNFTCAGSLKFTGQGPGMTETENVRHHRWDFGIQVGGEEVSGTSALTTPGLDPNAAQCPGAGLNPERLVGAFKVTDARFEPLSRSASHVKSFAVGFSSANASLAKTILPHQQSSMTDFDGTVTTSTLDLSFSGSVTFTLKGMMLPHGLLGAPDLPRYHG
jgi:hypothetical protein